MRIAKIYASNRKSGSRNTIHDSDVRLRPEVEIWPYRVCAMKNMQYNLFNGRIAEIFIGTVRLLWTWLWSRYHVPQNVFLVIFSCIIRPFWCKFVSLFLMFALHFLQFFSRSTSCSTLSWRLCRRNKNVTYCVCVGDTDIMLLLVCARFCSLETNAIEWKLWHIVQNGLNSRSITFCQSDLRLQNHSHSKRNYAKSATYRMDI